VGKLSAKYTLNYVRISTVNHRFDSWDSDNSIGIEFFSRSITLRIKLLTLLF